jgi:hypothetical protein
MTLDGVRRHWAVTVMGDVSYSHQQVVLHEMLHGYGLGHSGTFVNNGVNGYGNYWDVMSSPPRAVTDPTFGWIAPHPIADQKLRLGWLGSGVFEVPETSGCWRVRLDRLSTVNPTNPLTVKIPYHLPGHYYTLEARASELPDEYDTVLGCTGAVVIHEVDDARDEKALVVDPDNNRDTGDDAARWIEGETFSVLGEFVVEVEDVDSDGADVKISRWPLAPDALAAVDVTHELIKLAWTDRASCEREYQVQLRDACPASTPSCSSPVATVSLPGDSTCWTHAPLRPRESYQYRVRACLSAGADCSPWTPWTAAIATLEEPDEEPDCPPGSSEPHCVIK